MILRNKITGIEGKFMREFTNRFGVAIEVLKSDNMGYFAPKHEWEKVDSYNHKITVDLNERICKQLSEFIKNNQNESRF